MLRDIATVHRGLRRPEQDGDPGRRPARQAVLGPGGRRGGRARRARHPARNRLTARCISASTSARRASRPSSWTTTTVRRPWPARRLPSPIPLPLWSEQAPQDWWQAVVDSLDALANQAPAAMAAVRGIGLSGQMLGVTLLDAADTPHPAGLVVERRPGVGRMRRPASMPERFRRHRRLSRHAGLLGAQAAVADAARTRRPGRAPGASCSRRTTSACA